MLKIRSASKADFQWIFDGVRSIMQMFDGLPEKPDIPGGKECFDAMLNEPETYHIAVAECGGKRVGYAILQIGRQMQFGGRYAQIQDFFVDKQMRHLGVGKALMKYVDEFAVRHGINGIDIYQLPVGSELDEERNLFYKKSGYNLGGFARTKMFPPPAGSS